MKSTPMRVYLALSREKKQRGRVSEMRSVRGNPWEAEQEGNLHTGAFSPLFHTPIANTRISLFPRNENVAPLRRFLSVSLYIISFISLSFSLSAYSFSVTQNYPFINYPFIFSVIFHCKKKKRIEKNRTKLSSRFEMARPSQTDRADVPLERAEELHRSL